MTSTGGKQNTEKHTKRTAVVPFRAKDSGYQYHSAVVSQPIHLWPINVVIYNDPIRKSHLVASFALRCFQRLSIPNVATLQYTWRHNRYTSGSSNPVLSY